MQTDVLDVVIVGGGLVGGLTALLLAQGGVQATVLDAAPILDEHKTLSVANSTCIGTLVKRRYTYLKPSMFGINLPVRCRIVGMQVWNKNGYGEINFGHASKQEPHGEQALGSMVEPSFLNLAIQQQNACCTSTITAPKLKLTRVEEGVGYGISIWPMAQC